MLVGSLYVCVVIRPHPPTHPVHPRCRVFGVKTMRTAGRMNWVPDVSENERRRSCMNQGEESECREEMNVMLFNRANTHVRQQHFRVEEAQQWEIVK